VVLRRLRRGPSGRPAVVAPDPAPAAQQVVVVTDSTASLPPGAAQRWGIEVVPLEVGIGDARYREGIDLTAADLLAAMTSGVPVTTSQPPPTAFAEAYARAAERGAREVVSVHLSGELSGTVRAAEVAATTAPVPVHVVDSRTIAMALGFAAIAAAELARGTGAWAGTGDGVAAGGPGAAAGARAAGGAGAAEAAGGVGTASGAVADGAAVARRAGEVAAGASALFLVDSLDHLRRGGRIGAAAAAVGTLLGMRPLLGVRGGRVEVAGKVRTRRAARERLVALAVEEVGHRRAAGVAVHHLGQADVADSLAEEVRTRCGLPVEAVSVSEVSAVVGAHAGPGLLGVVVAGD
jgi:fatty acid-binding protein DegV